MSATADKVKKIINNCLDRLDELTGMPISQRAYFSYTEGEQTYNWGELYNNLQAKLNAAETDLKVAQAVDGPFTVAGPLGYG